MLAGDSDGAMRGLDTILRRAMKNVETLDDTERGDNGYGDDAIASWNYRIREDNAND